MRLFIQERSTYRTMKIKTYAAPTHLEGTSLLVEHGFELPNAGVLFMRGVLRANSGKRCES